MYDLLCHSGMALGTIATLAIVAASIGGLGLLAVSALKRATHRA